MRPRTDDEIIEDLKDWPVRNIYVERGVRLIEQLRQRVAELEKKNNDLWESFKLPRNDDILAIEALTAERDALKQQRDELVMALIEIHDLRPVGKESSEYALAVEHIARAAIASVKEKA